MNVLPLVIVIVGSVFASAILGFNIYMLTAFSLNPFSDDWSGFADQINWPIVLTWIELGFCISVLLLVFLTAFPYIEIKLEKNPMRFSMIFYSLILIGSVIISAYRLSETGIILEGLCKSDFCPTTRWVGEGCIFNNFADASDLWTSSGIDWSKETTYGKDNRQELYDAYVSARTASDDPINVDSADEMILYHDCWYWGCDSECHVRHDINRLAAYASLISSLLYTVIIILCVVELGADDYRPVAVAEPIEDEKLNQVGLEEGGSESDESYESDESDEFRDLRFRF